MSNFKDIYRSFIIILKYFNYTNLDKYVRNSFINKNVSLIILILKISLINY